MPEHEPRDLDVLWEIVRYLRVRQEQTTGNHGETFAITALLKELTQIIASLSNSQTIHIQEAMMNDYYQVGQAGAVGPNSIAIGQDFTQVWSKQAGGIDLNQLAATWREPHPLVLQTRMWHSVNSPMRKWRRDKVMGQRLSAILHMWANGLCVSLVRLVCR
jgi:hypothetical protein